MAQQIPMNKDDLGVLWHFLDRFIRDNLNQGNMYFPENVQLRDIYDRLTKALGA